MEKQKKSVTGRKTAETAFLILSLMIMALVLGTLSAGEQNESETFGLTDGWYIMENGTKTELSLPAVLETEGRESLTLYNDLLTGQDAGKVLTTRGAQYDLKVTVGDQVIYKYEDSEFPRNQQMKMKYDCDVTLPKDFDGGTVAFCYTDNGSRTYRIADIYIGSKCAIIKNHMQKGSLTFFIAFSMLVLAIVVIGVSFYMKYLQLEDKRYVDVAVFLLICSIWCITDSSIIQQYGGYFSIICVTSFYAFMLFPIPILYFVRDTKGMEQYKILDVLVVLFYLNAILQGIFNYFGLFVFVDMLVVTHLLLIAGIAVIIVLLRREYKEKETGEIGTIYIAFTMLAASGVFSLILYWLFEIPYYEVIFETGILIFVVVLLGQLVKTMVENIHFKTEMKVYKRLIREDKMTGMGNRTAFEEVISNIRKEPKQYASALLIFMDLNNLKYVNDHFGHGAGDSLIVGAARCICNAFEQEGMCFRIGGDEFGVILQNPTCTEAQLESRLDQEIQQYNKRSRYTLSIARGFSRLCEEGETMKTISAWKYDADSKMYANKKMQRRKM